MIAPRDRAYEVELILSGDKRYQHTGKMNFADPSFSQDTGLVPGARGAAQSEKELQPGMFVTAM